MLLPNTHPAVYLREEESDDCQKHRKSHYTQVKFLGLGLDCRLEILVVDHSHTMSIRVPSSLIRHAFLLLTTFKK